MVIYKGGVDISASQGFKTTEICMPKAERSLGIDIHICLRAKRKSRRHSRNRNTIDIRQRGMKERQNESRTNVNEERLRTKSKTAHPVVLSEMRRMTLSSFFRVKCLG